MVLAGDLVPAGTTLVTPDPAQTKAAFRYKQLPPIRQKQIL